MLFQRFAAATAVASIAVAFAAFIVLLTPRPIFERTHLLTILWCFAPCAWGIWALLTPTSWMPKRLPIWGAILGLIAGSAAFLVLNLPFRFFGQQVPLTLRGAAILVLGLFYCLLWMLVRAAYGLLTAAAEKEG